MPRRSKNSHQEKLDRLPFSARLLREDPMRAGDRCEMEEAAGRIAGPTGWYATAGRQGRAFCKLIHFATLYEAEEMQQWLDSTDIADRPMPKLGESREEKAASDREVIDWALSTGAGRRIVQAYRQAMADGDGHITGMLAAIDAAKAAGRRSDGLVPAVELIIRWAQQNHAEWFYRYRQAKPGEAPSPPPMPTEKGASFRRTGRPVEPPAPLHRPTF